MFVTIVDVVQNGICISYTALNDIQVESFMVPSKVLSVLSDKFECLKLGLLSNSKVSIFLPELLN